MFLDHSWQRADSKTLRTYPHSNFGRDTWQIHVPIGVRQQDLGHRDPHSAQKAFDKVYWNASSR